MKWSEGAMMKHISCQKEEKALAWPELSSRFCDASSYEIVANSLNLLPFPFIKINPTNNLTYFGPIKVHAPHGWRCTCLDMA